MLIEGSYGSVYEIGNRWLAGRDSLRLAPLAQCKLTILIFDQRSES